MAQQKQAKARDGASLWRDVGGKSIWLARQAHDIGGVGNSNFGSTRFTTHGEKGPKPGRPYE